MLKTNAIEKVILNGEMFVLERPENNIASMTRQFTPTIKALFLPLDFQNRPVRIMDEKKKESKYFK